MKKTIEIAVSCTKVETKEVEIDFPETAKYYISQEREISVEMIGIIPKYPNSTNAYYLVFISRNRQDFNDLHIKDCKSEYFRNDSNYLRALAIDILLDNGTAYHWSEITEDYFNEMRNELINAYKK